MVRHGGAFLYGLDFLFPGTFYIDVGMVLIYWRLYSGSIFVTLHFLGMVARWDDGLVYGVSFTYIPPDVFLEFRKLRRYIVVAAFRWRYRLTGRWLRP